MPTLRPQLIVPDQVNIRGLVEYREGNGEWICRRCDHLYMRSKLYCL
jgi:hypothetical protein